MKPKNIQTRFGAFFGNDGSDAFANTGDSVITASARFKECATTWRFVEPRPDSTTSLAFNCDRIFRDIPGQETERDAVAALLDQALRTEAKLKEALERAQRRVTAAQIWLGNEQQLRDRAFANGTIPVTCSNTLRLKSINKDPV